MPNILKLLEPGKLSALTVVVLVATPKLGNCTTTVVTPGPLTIQTAMAAAVAGDTLLLQPGLYAMDVSVDMTKPVAIISTEGPNATIVDLQENFGSVIFIRPMTGVPTIEGLTIRGGAQIFTSSGAGIYSSNASPRIVNNLIVANGASDIDGHGGAGAGIAIFGGSPYIANNTVVGNVSGSGAVYLANCSGLFTRNVIAFNSDLELGSSDGFGLACGNAMTTIVDNIFWNNQPEQIAANCSLVPPAGGNLVIDPQFCAPNFYPGSRLADWAVMTSGPTAPGHAQYGWGATLPFCASTSSSPSTWGRVKAAYRQ